MFERTYESVYQYYFSIHAPVEPRVVGEVPGGIRVDLGYKRGGKVMIRPQWKSPLQGVIAIDTDGTVGEVSSGQDWILIGRVGSGVVADFDGRVTLRFRARVDKQVAQTGQVAQKDRKKAGETGGVSPVVGGHVRGRVDLPNVKYTDWLRGQWGDTSLPLVLPLSLNVATVGPGGTWVEPGLEVENDVDDSFTALGQSLLLGVGHVSCEKDKKYSPLQIVELDVYKVTAQQR